VLFSFFLIVSLAFTKSKSVFNLGDPIPGVDVSLEQIPGGVKGVTQTDANGNYNFKDLKAGIYKIHIGSKKFKNTRALKKVNLINNRINRKNKVGFPGGIIIYAEDFNSSRSNLSQIVYHGQNVPFLYTKVVKSKLDLRKRNMEITIKLNKPVKVLKGALTY